MGTLGRWSWATVALGTLALPLWSEERIDLDAVHKIRQEALQNSKVMDHMFYLTDVYGPRLTNSPGFFSAADWVVKQLGEWGIKAHLEKWGPFGRGWTFTHFSGHLVEPQYAPLIGFPLAYSPGTNGPVTGDVTIAVLNAEPDFDKYKGKLRGKIVLVGTGRDLQMSLQPLAVRRTDADLASLSQVQDPAPQFGVRPPGADAAGLPGGRGGFAQNQRFQRAL